MTFQLRSLILESINILNIVFSQTIGPIELKFHVKTPYDKLVKIEAKTIWSHDQDGRHAYIW